ncbi:hypothetical protein BV25DRAFT_1829668 [Artomyces pyxidatus]|uniref:Uncharacterized protein n=1 Tax=Artomyces pyxidatus TaxID=48021 RepID=A0ACB8SR46_9AGAM|nr:hypothetical protein BV25DRAFT_1829668 [Artomyces pyxidatus]
MQPHFQHAPTALPDLNLPRTLTRPAFAAISRDMITAIDPSLAQVPLEYILQNVHTRGDELMASITTTTVPPSHPKSHLPPSFDIPIAGSSTTPPSHILAISAAHPPSDTALLIPTHAIVLATHCAHLPRLPPAQRNSSTPVVSLTVPAAAAFAPLHTFLVSRRGDQFVAALLLVQLPAGADARHLARHLATSAAGDALSALMARARAVHAVWQNACALGVSDSEMWAALDFAWEAVLGAMHLVAGRQPR